MKEGKTRCRRYKTNEVKKFIFADVDILGGCQMALEDAYVAEVVGDCRQISSGTPTWLALKAQ